ncbi:MAG: hypothetical protein FWC39_12295 [Bacteroidetes bacterium]|nr:hypothetical protein [Bacteroidota bacterium]
MKKSFLKISLLATIGFASVVFNSCGGDAPKPQDTEQIDPTDPVEPTDPINPTDPSIPENGVKIGNTTWATRNVGTNKSFVSNSQDYGNYYTYNDTENVCPDGWKVPTKAQQQELLDNTSDSWTSNYKETGVAGRVLTGGAIELFFPVAGYRGSGVSRLYGVGTYGHYLSSTESGYTFIYHLFFDSDNAYVNYINNKGDGLSVRCVSAE